MKTNLWLNNFRSKNSADGGDTESAHGEDENVNGSWRKGVKLSGLLKM